jgi:hypothetical protein
MAGFLKGVILTVAKTFTAIICILFSISGVGNVVQYFKHDAETAKSELALMSAKNGEAFYRLRYELCIASQDTIEGQGHVDTAETIHNAPAVPVATSSQTPPDSHGCSQIENNHSRTENTQKWVSTVEIDTSKAFGDTCNPMNVRVWARVQSTGKYQMLIQPTYRPINLNQEVKKKWERIIFVGGGRIRQDLAAQIGISLARGQTGLGINGFLTERGGAGLTMGMIYNF